MNDIDRIEKALDVLDASVGYEYEPLGQARAALASLRSRLAEQKQALRELVELKDSPRDTDYYDRKPLAWATARLLVAAAAVPEPAEKGERGGP